VPEHDFEMVRLEMLKRPVDPRRYRGLSREDKTLRWAVDELARIEGMREAGRHGEIPLSPTARPESLRRFADLLTELGWDDLAALARREELMVYHELGGWQQGAVAQHIAEALDALRGNLLDDGRHEEALAVVDEQLALGQHRAMPVAISTARQRRTVLLSQLGRHEEAVESAAVAVDEIRGRIEAAGGGAVDLELCHALNLYAEQLDRVGRVAEAADATAEALVYWRGRKDSRYHFAATADSLSDRLARSGRDGEAYAVMADAWKRLRRDDGDGDLAHVWHNFGVRLLSLGYPRKALAAADQAVKRHRVRVRLARDRHLAVEARNDWGDDHRYDPDYLWQQHRREVKEAHEWVCRAERNLRHALLTMAACLRQLNRADEAAAAQAEAATLGEAGTGTQAGSSA
jgi:tetratricopeptide (TPR) repeat protein